MSKSKLILVSVSDTHNRHRDIPAMPDGDVLIHCGDLSHHGEPSIIMDTAEWMGAFPHPHKLLIAGNHDRCFERAHQRTAAIEFLTENGITYLENSGVEIEGFHFWGSPVQPYYGGWSFNRQRGEDIDRHWQMIPENTDVLITHGPPFGILDEAPRDWSTTEHVGCKDLLRRIGELPNLKLSVYGHIHASSGMLEKEGIIFVNAAICGENQKATNPPRVVELTR